MITHTHHIRCIRFIIHYFTFLPNSNGGISMLNFSWVFILYFNALCSSFLHSCSYPVVSKQCWGCANKPVHVRRSNIMSAKACMRVENVAIWRNHEFEWFEVFEVRYRLRIFCSTWPFSVLFLCWCNPEGYVPGFRCGYVESAYYLFRRLFLQISVIIRIGDLALIIALYCFLFSLSIYLNSVPIFTMLWGLLFSSMLVVHPSLACQLAYMSSLAGWWCLPLAILLEFLFH